MLELITFAYERINFHVLHVHITITIDATIENIQTIKRRSVL